MIEALVEAEVLDIPAADEAEGEPFMGRPITAFVAAEGDITEAAK